MKYFLSSPHDVLFPCWSWLCAWHRSDRYSVASPLRDDLYILPWVTTLFGSLERFLLCQFLPCWGYCPACCGWVFLTQQAAFKQCVEGTSQALFPVVTSAIETPQSLVMPNPRQHQLHCHAFSSVASLSSTSFPS